MRRLILWLTAPLWFPGLLVLALVAGLFGPMDEVVNYSRKSKGWNHAEN